MLSLSVLLIYVSISFALFPYEKERADCPEGYKPSPFNGSLICLKIPETNTTVTTTLIPGNETRYPKVSAGIEKFMKTLNVYRTLPIPYAKNMKKTVR